MTATKTEAVIVGLAGFWGLSGVACLAAGAHADSSGLLTTAGQFLLFHAATVMGLQAVTHPRLVITRISPQILMLLGSALFALDLVLHVKLGHAPIPFMAPAGGLLAMGGWLQLCVVSVVSFFKTS